MSHEHAPGRIENKQQADRYVLISRIEDMQEEFLPQIQNFIRFSAAGIPEDLREKLGEAIELDEAELASVALEISDEGIPADEVEDSIKAKSQKKRFLKIGSLMKGYIAEKDPGGEVQEAIESFLEAAQTSV